MKLGRHRIEDLSAELAIASCEDGVAIEGFAWYSAARDLGWDGRTEDGRGTACPPGPYDSVLLFLFAGLIREEEKARR